MTTALVVHVRNGHAVVVQGACHRVSFAVR